MADLSRTIGLKGDIVESSNLWETMASGIASGMINTFEQSLIPQNTLPWYLGTQAANIAGGIAMQKAFGGSVGTVLGNAFTITGAWNIGNYLSSILLGSVSGTSNESTTNATGGAVIL